MMKNKELVIKVYDENGPDVQDVILEAFEKYVEMAGIENTEALNETPEDILYDIENKYVFVACASTNFDRIAGICSAVPRGKYCLCDKYQKSLLDVVTEHSGKFSRLYQFPKMLTYSDTLLDKMEKQGFCMFIRLGNYLSNKLLERFEDKNPLIVYSMWSGYLDDDRIKNAVDGYRMEKLHTSGHSDMETIEKVVEIVKPSIIIPIHTETPNNFPYSQSACEKGPFL